MTQTDDSSTKRRTVLRYDGLDRLLEEETYDILAPATPVTLSKLTYTYDPVGRRSGMTVAGQPTVTYTWDDASRLTQIQQAAGPSNNNIVRTVGFTYDEADRRKKTVLANGVTVDYGYDDASQLVSIIYKKADTTLIGDLTYGYDAVGRRVRTSGSMAEIDLPNTVASATYDANNRLTNWNGTPYTYDDNGNLLNDGSLTYTWNSRNQLASISGAASGTFAYDAFGRRIGKTVAGVSTGYVYDGQNFVQEKNGTASTATPTANLVTGLGFDETFARMTGSGASAVVRHPLADGNNNTVRLRDDAGAYTDIFTYEPYGKTTHTGPDGASQQYTGRENDNTGLYYYRARYYHPTVGEDPIGLGGGSNLYAYVGGNPVSWMDPFGLFPEEPGLAPACPECLLYPMLRIVPTIWNLTRPGTSTASTAPGLPPSGINPPVKNPDMCKVGPSTRGNGKSVWDENGGEWRWKPEDKWHNPHWDYNPWDRWSSEWQNVPVGSKPPIKP